MAKQIPPAESPGVPSDFKAEIEKEAERQIEVLTTYAVTVLSTVPERVAARIKSVKMDWTLIGIALASSASGGIGESQL